MALIFSFVTYSSDGLSPFPSYLKLVLQPYVKFGNHLLPCRRKGFTLTAPLIIHERARTSTAPSTFPVGDVSGKVWSTLITTQQEGIYPKSLLGFANCYVNSPVPIYWRIALCVYSLCANILALRRILSVECKYLCMVSLTLERLVR